MCSVVLINLEKFWDCCSRISSLKMLRKDVKVTRLVWGHFSDASISECRFLWNIDMTYRDDAGKMISQTEKKSNLKVLRAAGWLQRTQIKGIHHLVKKNKWYWANWYISRYDCSLWCYQLKLLSELWKFSTELCLSFVGTCNRRGKMIEFMIETVCTHQVV